ncbi:glycosyltransferase [Flavobacterium piscisymbiosum]|uniref:Glycosyltransferase n=1 Tax=Flavobacterium piscisymbiosum TaxID=2893753 RepID=A0ABS8M8A3_9FLAO|nr:glycosyltransferase [Flavobacterium sp. F-30]MCC9061718.1 glycosyltransferase [Flavobacterium sp. F-30]
MISVVIRTKNQESALTFLLKNLTERYNSDIDEIIVIDNLSTDKSQEVCEKYGAKFITITNFSYGGSANLAAKSANHPIVVIFSAHSYPVSHDFFKLIKIKFEENSNLAGLRCLHSSNDFRGFLNKIEAQDDPNKAGLIFSGSAFNKSVWQKHPFREDVATFEDKEWTKRVLKEGYDIEFVPSIFHYEIKRSREQIFFRFKNDVIGNYQLWHQDITFSNVFNSFFKSFYTLFENFIIDAYYVVLKLFYLIKFLFNKPHKF